jgi:hypothetical protein
MPRSVFRRVVSVALVVAAVTTSTATMAPTASADTWCPQGVVDRPGLGRSCAPANGLFQLEADRGTALFTHGGDPAPLEPAVVNATPSDPVCVTDPNDFQILVTYAHPPADDRFATRATQIRDLVREANGRLDEEAGEFLDGINPIDASYRVSCSSAQVTVMNQALTLSPVNFNTVTAALRALGGVYTNRRYKHWIWFEGASGTGEAGVGSFYNDDDLSIANLSNGNLNAYFQSPATMAIQWGHCCFVDPTAGFLDSTTWMHEMGHNLGAVQGDPTVSPPIDASPNSSGYGHCNDDLDVMCYDDFGPFSGGYTANVCTDREHFDCNHDDYFNPAPQVGNYLFTHWNLGSCLNRYIQFSHCAADPHQADGWVSKASSGPWRGDGVINETAQFQTMGKKGRRNVAKTFYVRVENVGSTPQTFTLRELANGGNLTRFYIYPAGSGGYNVNSLVTGAGLPLVIPAGQTKTVRVVMWFSNVLAINQKRGLTIRVLSDDVAVGLSDVVKLQLTYV